MVATLLLHLGSLYGKIRVVLPIARQDNAAVKEHKNEVANRHASKQADQVIPPESCADNDARNLT